MTDQETTIPTLDELYEAGIFSSLEFHLAKSLSSIAGDDHPWVGLALALAGRGPQHGQVCVMLQKPPQLTVLADESEEDQVVNKNWAWPDPDEWAEVLKKSPLVGDGSRRVPLVLDQENRLYLYRYFRYQKRLIQALRKRASILESDLDLDLLKDGIARLFAGGDEEGTGGQRQAAVMAILRRFSVISGGPGTGKTTTVLKILALLQEQARAAGKNYPLKIELLAPTGKAAARLSESIKVGKTRVDAEEELEDQIPDEASTIHRRLGYQHHRPTRFVHDENSPLPADVVVVDESSMVDLALMTKLVEAVPTSARLILLGDRDQLASIEAGAILGDICNVGGIFGGFSEDFSTVITKVLGESSAKKKSVPALKTTSPIADCIVHLSRSFRFDERSGIGALSRAINRGDVESVISYLSKEKTEHPELTRTYQDIEWLPIDDRDGTELRPEIVLGRRLTQGYSQYLEVKEPMEAIRAFGKFRVLCAHRRGRMGVESINHIVRAQLARKNLVSAQGNWYAGRPVLITENDYQIGLFNGDIGLTLAQEGDPGRLRVHFLSSDGRSTRSFHPARLPSHETAFAMTVHKSQGSEFDRVLLLLPRTVSPIMSRELLYTGVTRARKKVTLAGADAVIREAVSRRVLRASGLRQALWQAEEL